MDKVDIVVSSYFDDENLEQLLIKLVRNKLNSSSIRAEIREKLYYNEDNTTISYQHVEVSGK